MTFRSRLISGACMFPRLTRAALRIVSPILPYRAIFNEIVSGCGGKFVHSARLGNGMPVSVYFGDVVGYGIATEGWYEPKIVDLLRPYLRPEVHFFDVGAHVGQYSLLASPLVAQVHAFEANPDTAKLLRRNVSRNGLANVLVNETAVVEKPGGMISFYDGPAGNSGGASLHGWREGIPSADD